MYVAWLPTPRYPMISSYKKFDVVFWPIHPLISFCLSGIGLWWQQAKQGIQVILLPANIFQLLFGVSKAFLC